MNGIAGVVSLTAARPVPREVVQRMSAAQAHRGSHEVIIELPEIALAVRSDSMLESDQTLAGQTGDRFAWALDGQLHNEKELRSELGATNHEENGGRLIPELWERLGATMCERLRGQFALAVWDERKRCLLLARDHFGIRPLHWARQGDWFLFASEIKAILASGLIDVKADLRGVHHVWTFFGVPGPITCFDGVSALLPGRFLAVRAGSPAKSSPVQGGVFWKMDFPNSGQETRPGDESQLVDEYEAIMLRSIDRRFSDTSSTGVYSSGGLDSSILMSMAAKLRGSSFDTYTFSIEHPGLDESALAADVADHVGGRPHVLELTGRKLFDALPRLIAAAESPVIDISASALLQLAESVRASGHTAVITGEGADELQAGYPWFRIQQRLDRLERMTKLPVSGFGFRGYARLVHLWRMPRSFINRSFELAHGKNAWLLAYMLMATAKYRFFSRDTLAALGDHLPLEDLELDHDGLARWSALNRSIYLGTRVHLPGLHLAARGDRAAGHSGVEPRYPFLDRELFDFLAPLAPDYKLRGLTDKYLERQLAQRWLPETVTSGRKSLLHAPLDAFHSAVPPRWAKQLLSQAALENTGYFDVRAVRHWQGAVHQMRKGFKRLFIEMGLLGVVTTQLWHQQYLDAGLADLEPAIGPLQAVKV